MKDKEHADGHDPPAGPTDYYRLLRVDPDAPHELVAEAYWYLASRLPAERELAALNSAYRILAAAEQRWAYDATVSRVLELRRERADRAAQLRRRPLLARLLKKPPRRSQVDYYELLRVDPGAEPPLIARAYSILRTLHSKKSADEAPKEYLSDLAQARTVLLNRERRSAYDESRAQPGSAPEVSPAPEAKPAEKAPEVATETIHKLIMRTGLIILVAAASVGIYGFASNVPRIRNAVVLATTAKPEAFTELYFEDHNNLPRTIEAHKEYSFTFTIHNLEHKDVAYPYIVYLQTDSGKTILDSGRLSLKNDEYKSQKEDFGPLTNLRTEIVVELTNKNQQIDFWMEEQ